MCVIHRKLEETELVCEDRQKGIYPKRRNSPYGLALLTLLFRLEERAESSSDWGWYAKFDAKFDTTLSPLTFEKITLHKNHSFQVQTSERGQTPMNDTILGNDATIKDDPCYSFFPSILAKASWWCESYWVINFLVSFHTFCCKTLQLLWPHASICFYEPRLLENHHGIGPHRQCQVLANKIKRSIVKYM